MMDNGEPHADDAAEEAEGTPPPGYYPYEPLNFGRPKPAGAPERKARPPLIFGLLGGVAALAIFVAIGYLVSDVYGSTTALVSGAVVLWIVGLFMLAWDGMGKVAAGILIVALGVSVFLGYAFSQFRAWY